MNLRTGRVITVGGVYNVSGVDFAADDFLPGTDSEDGSFRFKKDSRLLVLVGALNEDESKQGAFYYVLKGEKLELVHKTIAVRNTCQEERCSIQSTLPIMRRASLCRVRPRSGGPMGKPAGKRPTGYAGHLRDVKETKHVCLYNAYRNPEPFQHIPLSAAWAALFCRHVLEYARGGF